MAESLVSGILDKLTSTILKELEQEIRLVLNVETQIEQLSNNFKHIQGVLVDAEKRMIKEEAVKIWLQNLKQIAYKIDNLLDEWNTAILKAQMDGAPPDKKKRLFSCLCCGRIVMWHDIGTKVQECDELLQTVVSEKDRFNFRIIQDIVGPDHQRMSTTSVLDVSEIFGRDVDRDVMLSQLLTDGSTTYLRVLAIVGMAGMGKTTLARLVYNEFEVQSHFDKKIWVSVPYPFNEMTTAKAILSRCVEEGVPNLSSLDMESIVQQIKKSVLGKKIFLVLDDVWVGENEVWEPLINAIKYGSQGSRIFLTTRNEEVAQILGATFVYRLGKMADEHCLSLFNQIAHFGRSMEEKEHLEEMSMGLVNKCDGLPLAVKFLGSLMRLKNTEIQRHDVLNSELWQLKGVDTGLFGSILLSYHDLPSELKPCLSLCSIFSPRDETIKKEQLISLWIAQGYVSSRGDTDVDVLGVRSKEGIHWFYTSTK